MDARRLDDTLSTSPQIALEDIPAIAAAGYRAVLSNRPDGESPDQPDAAAVRRAAEAAGLAFAHIPVTAAGVSDEDVTTFRTALTDLPGPVYGFCRSGMRTAMMWALARASDTPVDDVVRTAAAAGYDLAPLRSRLETQRR